MLLTGPTNNPFAGLSVQNFDMPVLSHAAIAVGDVVALSFSTVANTTFTTTATPIAGDIASTVGAFSFKILCVALTATTAASQPLTVRVVGDVSALIGDTSAAGTWMMANTSKQLVAATASVHSGTMVVAIIRETGVAGSTKKVFFNGFGFGQLITNAGL